MKKWQKITLSYCHKRVKSKISTKVRKLRAAIYCDVTQALSSASTGWLWRNTDAPCSTQKQEKNEHIQRPLWCKKQNILWRHHLINNSSFRGFFCWCRRVAFVFYSLCLQLAWKERNELFILIWSIIYATVCEMEYLCC